MRLLATVGLVPATLLLCIVTAAAQPSAADVQAAAAAYTQAQQAQLRGDHAAAANLFELAHRSAPSPQAIRSAIRSHIDAGALRRGATLSLEALAAYPDDPDTRALVDEVLGEAERTLARVDVDCDPRCALTIDGTAVQAGAAARIQFFAQPGSRTLAAVFENGGQLTRDLALIAGGRVALDLTPPPESIPEPEETPTPEQVEATEVVFGAEIDDQPLADGGSSSGLHPAIVLSLAGLAVVGAGLSIWSGLDTLSARDAYEMNATTAGLQNGYDLQTRTNVLFFSTVGVGLTALVLAFFTDWSFGGGAEEPPPVVVDLSPQGGSLTLVRTFGGASH